MSPSETPGEQLRAARVRAGLTPAELARRAGVPPTVVNAYESGRRPIPLPALQNLVAAAGSPLPERAEPEPAPQPLSGPVGRRVRRRREQLRRMLAEHGVENARVFGSVARGTEEPGSDLDLLVSLPNGVTAAELAELRVEIEAVVGAPVQLVSVESVSPLVREALEAAAVPL